MRFMGQTNRSTGVPTIKVRSLTFSDGTKISIGPSDIVVLVGPNNSGKSKALDQIRNHLIDEKKDAIVLKKIEFLRSGSSSEVEEFIAKNSVKIDDKYCGYQFNVEAKSIPGLWGRNSIYFRRDFVSAFCMNVVSETRIQDSNPATSVSFLNDPPTHPIHMLYKDERLERQISKYFERAFNQELIVFRMGGASVPLLVGRRPKLKNNEDRLSIEYNKQLEKCAEPLESQGDGMRSFATVVLHLFAPIIPSIMLLDEPEAFLHPPQARLLGELIAAEMQEHKQVFLTTHSTDIIQGLLAVPKGNLRILRIERHNDINLIKELDKDRVKKIASDPLARQTVALAGVFHQRVVICESDSDCMFYESIMNLPNVNNGSNPDVQFVHTAGKDRIPKLSKDLFDLGVQVDIIVDIDVLREEKLLQKIYESLGGNWAGMRSHFKTVRSSIESNVSLRKTQATIAEFRRSVDQLEGPTSEHQLKNWQDIQSILKKGSPWTALKRAGENAIPNGRATQQYDILKRHLSRKGVWIVPVGELEGFCKHIGFHGPRWVQSVLENYDLRDSAELEDARQFVQQIWGRNDPK